MAEAPDFVCEGCRPWLKDLAHHCEVVDARRRAIRQKLDEILVEGEEDEEGMTGFVMTDVGRRALAQNKGLKVTLDMEIT